MSNKLQQMEQLAKTRAVHGWTSMELSREEDYEILRFLNGGPCPEKYKREYAICREQLGLPELKEEK